MLSTGQVRARVVDVRDRRSRLPVSVVCDTQILYWQFYPSFSALAAAGGRAPSYYQIQVYPRYFTNLLKAKVEVLTSSANLGELARLIEYAELEVRCLTDPQDSMHLRAGSPPTSFTPRMCKEARYKYASDLPKIRRTVCTVLASVKKAVSVLPAISGADNEYTHALSEWNGCSADYVDALTVALAKAHGVSDILSDDVDFATINDITVYTGNHTTVDSARIAGKLG
jgi:hypothetical protein